MCPAGGSPRGGRPRRCCRRGRAGSRRSSRRGTRAADPACPSSRWPAASRAPEGLDELARARAEADVQAAGDGVLGVGHREREVVPLGEPRVAVGRSMPSGRAPCVEGLGRSAVGDSDGHVVEHSEQLAQRGVLAHVLLDLGLASIASASAARAPASSPSPAARARARRAGRGSRGACRGRRRTTSRAAAGSLSARATARNIHSQADGSKVGGPPKLSTVVPALRPLRGGGWPVSGTKT
jgi:hypothetical protein